jgi:hypothetical protein
LRIRGAAQVRHDVEAKQAQVKRWLYPLVLLVFVGVIQVATMPSMYYPGDNFASRQEAMFWLSTGHYGIPYELRHLLKDMVAERGQYFYENDVRQRFFSRYGIGNVLAYMLPAWLDMKTGGKPDPSAPIWMTRSGLFWNNLMQVILSLIIAFYLYAMALLYTRRRGLAVAFVLASIYPSFLWHYLRAPTHEIFLIFSCVGASYHFLVFLRSAEGGLEGDSTRWSSLSLAVLYGCFLVSAKLFFVLFVALLFLFALLAGTEPRSLFVRPFYNLRRFLPKYLLYAGFLWFFFVVVLLWVNAYRFGSPLGTGYDQWLRAGSNLARFEWGIFPVAFAGFFIQLGDKNVFLQYPLMLIALFSFPFLALRRGLESAFLAAVFFILTGILCFFASWAGEWCYGPRLLVPYLSVVAVASVAGVDALLERSRAVTGVFFAVFVLISGWLVTQQASVNSLHPFAYHQVSGVFRQGDVGKLPAVEAYHNSIWHRARVFRDIREHARGGRLYPPYRAVQEALRNHPERERILQRLNAFLMGMGRLNYWFLDREPIAP